MTSNQAGPCPLTTVDLRVLAGVGGGGGNPSHRAYEPVVAQRSDLVGSILRFSIASRGRFDRLSWPPRCLIVRESNANLMFTLCPRDACRKSSQR